MRPENDEPLADLAAEQGGVVGHHQAVELGYHRRALVRRLAAGRLHEIHPAVYGVGHTALTQRGWLMAAVLAGGPGAVASHWSAAWWHGLLPTSPTRHDVTTRRHREARGVRFHRNKRSDDVVTVHEGVPVTTVARTILDLADVATERTLERVLDRSEIDRSLHFPDLLDLVERSNGRHGRGRLRRVLERHAPGSTLTESELEERMLAQIRDAALPSPIVNAQIGEFRVDLHWPAHALVVELDGAAYHHTRRAFVEDRRRDVALQLAGLHVLRFTWPDVIEFRAIAAITAFVNGGVSSEGRQASRG